MFFFPFVFFPPLRRFSTRNLTTRFILQYPTFYSCSCPSAVLESLDHEKFPISALTHTHARLSPCSCFIFLTAEFSNSSVIFHHNQLFPFPVHQTGSIKTAWPAVLRGSPRYYLTYFIYSAEYTGHLDATSHYRHNTCGSKSIIRLLC